MLNKLHVPLEFPIAIGSYHIQIWGKSEQYPPKENARMVSIQSEKLSQQYIHNFGLHLQLLNQVHGNKVVEMGMPHPDLPDADSMFSASTKLALGIKTADCIPVLFFHRKKILYGAIHTGWKGLELKTFTKTIEQLKDNPSDFFFIIGPHIFVDNYETSEDIYSKFPLEFCQPGNNVERKHLSLVKILRKEMQTCGIDDHQVMQIEENTFGSNRFFSHRSGNSGRNFNVIFFIQKKNSTDF